MLRYLVGFFITVGLIVLLIILLFSGGNDTSKNKKLPGTGKTLSSYANTDAQVRLTIDGPVTANQNHRVVQVTVDRNSAVFKGMNGYEGNTTIDQSYNNNEASFRAFLRSLELIGYTNGDTTSSLKDETGHCASGSRYVFELIKDGKDIERFWATSCGSIRTYKGSVTTSLHLFQKQIPDYDKLNEQAQI
jgi:hypothetical protein